MRRWPGRSRAASSHRERLASRSRLALLATISALLLGGRGDEDDPADAGTSGLDLGADIDVGHGGDDTGALPDAAASSDAGVGGEALAPMDASEPSQPMVYFVVRHRAGAGSGPTDRRRGGGAGPAPGRRPRGRGHRRGTHGLDRWVARVDANADGVLSVEEIHAYERAKQERRFVRLDTDGS